MGNQNHAASADSSAAQLNQGGSDLIPGYFDHPADTSPAMDTASLDDGADDMLDLA
ncbi:MAG: hypothetical protein HYR68_02750 [Burkholderiales bacterium]|nr:hypothetical protein [Burkholderiales bacterium]